jgi:hypothetical protein
MINAWSESRLTLRFPCQNEAYAGLRSGGVYHFDFRIPGGLTTVFDAMPNKMPAINLVALESAYGGGRALLVNRMSSEVCAVMVACVMEESGSC